MAADRTQNFINIIEMNRKNVFAAWEFFMQRASSA